MSSLHDASDAIAAAAALGATIPAPVGTVVYFVNVEAVTGMDDDEDISLGVYATRDSAISAAVTYLRGLLNNSDATLEWDDARPVRDWLDANTDEDVALALAAGIDTSSASYYLHISPLTVQA